MQYLSKSDEYLIQSNPLLDRPLSISYINDQFMLLRRKKNFMIDKYNTNLFQYCISDATEGNIASRISYSGNNPDSHCIHTFQNFIFMWNNYDTNMKICIFKIQNDQVFQVDSIQKSKIYLSYVKLKKSTNMIAFLESNPQSKQIRITYFRVKNDYCRIYLVKTYRTKIRAAITKIQKVKGQKHQYIVETLTCENGSTAKTLSLAQIKITPQKFAIKIVRTLDTSALEFHYSQGFLAYQSEKISARRFYHVDFKKQNFATTLTSLPQKEGDFEIKTTLSSHFSHQENPMRILNKGSEVMLFNHLNSETITHVALPSQLPFNCTIVINRQPIGQDLYQRHTSSILQFFFKSLIRNWSKIDKLLEIEEDCAIIDIVTLNSESQIMNVNVLVNMLTYQSEMVQSTK